jgi:PAS domain S-box-containing protein
MRSISAQFENVASQLRSRNWRVSNAPLDLRTIVTGLLVFVGYYVGAKIGFALTFQPRPVSVLWPPNSVLVAAFLLTPPRVWWFILLAAFPAHWAAQLQSHVPPLMILCWFISNSCEAVIGAGLARYLVGGPIRFTNVRNMGIFCLCVVFIGPFLSSFLDAAFVVWNDWGQGGYWQLIRIRLFSNVLAALIVVPLIITWATNGTQALRKARPTRCLEACALLVGLLLVSYAVLYQFGSGTDAAPLFLPLPFLLWAAVRFGALGASTAMSIVGFLVIWSASHGHGPFSGGTAEQNALSVQIFLIVLAITLLFLATVIEERITAETELRESESRFRIVADAAPVLIWMSGVDKLRTFFNKAWLEFTGRVMKEELGSGWADGVHADDLQKCLKTYTEAFDARQPFVMQYRLRRHDGDYRCINDEGVPRFDSKGQFIGYIGSCVDVSDLLQKERELNESEERVALAAEAAHLGVWELDTTTNKIWLSDQARKLFQFEPEAEITYSLWNDRVHPEDRALRKEAIRRAVDTRGRYEIEYRIVLPDQTVRWIAGRGHCVGNPETKRGRLLGVSMDVTERKQAEQLFQLAAEGSHLGVWDWDETTGKLLWDGATREIFDVPVEGEVALDTFYRAVYPHDLERVKGVWRRAVESGLPYQIEFRVRRSNGAIGWVHARGRGYYDDKGKPLRMIGVVFDITDRKQAELEAAQRREDLGHLSRVAAMGEMAASIAHELNQPLSGIISNASAGQRFIGRGHVDLREIRELLADIAADARRAGDIIRGVRSMVTKSAPVRQQINLNELVMKVARIVTANAMLHSCKLEARLEPKLPAIEADPIQLQQVLLNLIINAFDAMRDTPVGRRKVAIATGWNGDGTILTSIRDYGVGIPEEACMRVFEHFFTTKTKGLGMGLAIVRSIVESHGGTITAENAEDGGARFQFTLPVAPISTVPSSV